MKIRCQLAYVNSTVCGLEKDSLEAIELFSSRSVRTWSSSSAPRRSSSNACDGAFANHVTFEFGEGGHHGEEEFPFSGRPVGSGECAGEDLAGDVFVVEVFGDGEDFFDGSVEAVQFSPDAESVALSEVVERGDKPGTDSGGRRNRGGCQMVCVRGGWLA